MLPYIPRPHYNEIQLRNPNTAQESKDRATCLAWHSTHLWGNRRGIDETKFQYKLYIRAAFMWLTFAWQLKARQHVPYLQHPAQITAKNHSTSPPRSARRHKPKDFSLIVNITQCRKKCKRKVKQPTPTVIWGMRMKPVMFSEKRSFKKWGTLLTLEIKCPC